MEALKAKIAAKMASMQDQVDKLVDENKVLKEEKDKLDTENESLKRRVTLLEDSVDKAESEFRRRDVPFFLFDI
eukprot:m.338754 g.338754  ORF g.338754 m.338754 type:complete len:74 (-) comp16538_c0_seq3:1273-1494(-)